MASASLVGMDKRKKDLEVIPEAESAYGDWKGTSCAENSLMVTSGDLYELAGPAAEPDRWPIVGIDIHAHSHGADPRWTIHVYAADLEELGATGVNGLNQVAAKHGGIPVVDVLLHDATLDDVIKCMKLLNVQLRNSYLQHPLLHAAYADHPAQD